MATYGALTVILAVIFRNERLDVSDWLGVAFTTTGILLVALVVDGGWRSARPVSIGVGFRAAGRRRVRGLDGRPRCADPGGPAGCRR